MDCPEGQDSPRAVVPIERETDRQIDRETHKVEVEVNLSPTPSCYYFASTWAMFGPKIVIYHNPIAQKF